MRQAIIMTDTNTEIPFWFAKENKIPFVRMPYTIDNIEYEYDLGEHTDFKAFYNKVRAGSMPITSTLPPQYYVDFYRPMLEAGRDIIYLCFSSALSSAQTFAKQGAEMALEEFPDRKITVVDTLSISGGAAILVYNAINMQKQGASDEEIITWVEENRLKMNHWFTVDDLNHLRRGGRISAAAAMVGGVLDLKPILSVNNEGRLVAVSKVKGRKKAIRTLFDEVCERIVSPEEQPIVLLNADSPVDAATFENMLREKFAFKHFWAAQVGPVIGTHCGPGTLAVLFMGEQRFG